MKQRFAFFDVDKTILERDSMYDLLFYTWKKHPISIIPSMLKLLSVVIVYLFKGANDIRILKEGVFFSFRYLSEEELRYFAQELLLKKKSFRAGIAEIKLKHEQGCIVALVSASPERYLKYFPEVLPVDKIIGTTVDENGVIDGENCKHDEKVRRIKAWLIANEWEIDYEESFGYSDSLSADGPMLELVQHRYLINSSLQVEGYKNLYWER
ncbi:haloacid dehalogenase-like hydrolase [Andreesenia angusta]|uniref:Haloacid dehalogenase-like hydrolase n=1 Tax=Andreesenia angusta TaxID=39480 RepID=A0A1S1V585_9FIRM|nr:HAD family hydrolase [Andreesenia angusta]OHW61846.1 haloacid dehalogenase-like hydrolase [Andreesenia angusta]